MNIENLQVDCRGLGHLHGFQAVNISLFSLRVSYSDSEPDEQTSVVSPVAKSRGTCDLYRK